MKECPILLQYTYKSNQERYLKKHETTNILICRNIKSRRFKNFKFLNIYLSKNELKN